MRITNTDTLSEDALKDIYAFEKRLVPAILKMVKSATSEELRSGSMEHLEVTRNLKGIIAEGDERRGEDLAPPLRDVSVAAAARCVEHYEMAAYSAAGATAEHLGHGEIADLLRQNLDEKREANQSSAKQPPGSCRRAVAEKRNRRAGG